MWIETPVWVPPIALTKNCFVYVSGALSAVMVYVGEVNPVWGAPVTGDVGEYMELTIIIGGFYPLVKVRDTFIPWLKIKAVLKNCLIPGKRQTYGGIGIESILLL